jgi:hypothetical protein
LSLPHKHPRWKISIVQRAAPLRSILASRAISIVVHHVEDEPRKQRPTGRVFLVERPETFPGSDLAVDLDLGCAGLDLGAVGLPAHTGAEVVQEPDPYILPEGLVEGRHDQRRDRNRYLEEERLDVDVAL